MLVINNFEVFNELERFSWRMIYPLSPLLFTSKWYLNCCSPTFPSIKASLPFLPSFSAHHLIFFIYFLINHLALFAFSKLIALQTLPFTTVSWEQENEICLLHTKLIRLYTLFPLF